MSQRHANHAQSSESTPTFGGLRRFRRRELEMEVVVQDAGGWEIPVESVDISPTGMFVRSDFLFETGSTHVLIFRAPNGAFLFRLSARVVRVENDEDMPGMAYEFIGVDADTRARLHAMMSDSKTERSMTARGTPEA